MYLFSLYLEIHSAHWSGTMGLMHKKAVGQYGANQPVHRIWEPLPWYRHEKVAAFEGKYSLPFLETT